MLFVVVLKLKHHFYVIENRVRFGPIIFFKLAKILNRT